MATMYDLLMQLPVFQGISVEHMTHILEVIPFDFRTHKVGEIILSGGDLCPGTTFLLSGRVRLETPVFNHRVKITQLFDAPYTFSSFRGKSGRLQSQVPSFQPKTAESH